MRLDIRKPIGLLLLVLGLQLVLYGMFGPASAKALDMNVNLVWGAVLACTGGAFLVVALLGNRKSG